MRTLTGYRVHVAIFRGDMKGKILQAMTSGRQATRETKAEAVAYAHEFVEMANAVPGRFDAYGAVIVQCQTTGDLITSLPLHKGAVSIKATERV